MPKLELDAVFEQKNDIAKAVEEELEKVNNLIDSIRIQSLRCFEFCLNFLCIRYFCRLCLLMALRLSRPSSWT